MDIAPESPRHNSPTVRVIALVVGLALLLAGGLLLRHGITGFTAEATSGHMSGRDTAASLLVVAAGGASLVLALAAARVAEVI